ncbi:RnfH family protein [Echinimonas agarilytica]|uniref:UPF0125 protein NAF29_08205 n=1 Tax=Echinimonas agarilytica TaxID=1215918 RepID=A0AA41W6X8_9GAMM|nr:RnfH family protein [Echinimonas agarilytica]MCM2679648.1 RnfH family protein [Echinimonas agarilytica]
MFTVPNEIAIEVAYALPLKQTLLSVSVPEDSTVKDAIEASGILDMHSDIDLLGDNKVGVWSRACKLDSALKDGDRIEIYRPLIADPKQVRKMRAEKAKLEGRADKVTGGRVNPKRASN